MTDRPGGRLFDQMREVRIERNFFGHAEGSVLIGFGATKVVCTASVEPGVPSFLRGSGKGWITAEYGMLPRSTDRRMDREAVRGGQGGRTIEIQRLIGRSLRAAVDMDLIGESTIKLDCDVIQADGGTRTASITGGCVALFDALQSLDLGENPFKQWIAAVSVGICEGRAVLDLEYEEDSNAGTDMNVVMASNGGFVEVQGTAEGATYNQEKLEEMLALARKGIRELLACQQAAYD